MIRKTFQRSCFSVVVLLLLATSFVSPSFAKSHGTCDTQRVLTPPMDVPGQHRRRERPYRGSMHPGLTVALNLFPLPMMGVGSFVQGDTLGGVIILASGLTSVVSLIAALGLTGSDVGKVGTVRIPALLALGLSMLSGILSLTWSIAGPFRYAYGSIRPAILQARINHSRNPGGMKRFVNVHSF